MYNTKKIAIVYDWIDKWGGVERVLLTLHEMFPQAEFYTSYYDDKKALWAKDLNINTSFIQKLPKFIKGIRIASLPFYPYAFESFDFSGYDLVISVTSSFAKSIITKRGTRHICYLLTPTRFLWSQESDYFKNATIKSLLSPYLSTLRDWDYVAAQRPDQIISISQTVADRCKKYYKRDSTVIYPPFDISYWNNIKQNVILERPKGATRLPARQVESFMRMTKDSQKYFLVVSRLEPYKKVGLVIETFKDLVTLPSMQRSSKDGETDSKYQLVIAGEGSKEQKLKQMAGKSVTFLSKLTDEELGYLYTHAEALIMPQEEDFGYVSLEAQFFSCPVIAYKKGGAAETVRDGKTGMFFSEQTEKSLKEALMQFDMVKYELKNSTKEFGIKNVERFGKEKFVKQFSRHFDPPNRRGEI